jgi:excisionase family DNA binding protein
MAFSTYEVAEMLEVNPETVRRWIRDGKLQATRDSKKNGFCVEESELKIFLHENPKYKNRGFLTSKPNFLINEYIKMDKEDLQNLCENLKEVEKAIKKFLKTYKPKES